MLELLVLKNAVECTSQRLKWTSGARVMIFFGRSVARSLGRSVARSLVLPPTTSNRSPSIPHHPPPLRNVLIVYGSLACVPTLSLHDEAASALALTYRSGVERVYMNAQLDAVPYCWSSCMQVPGQWIVTWARLRNLGQVIRYVLVTGYNFIPHVRLQAQAKNGKKGKIQKTNFENARFSFLLTLPCGRPRS